MPTKRDINAFDHLDRSDGLIILVLTKNTVNHSILQVPVSKNLYRDNVYVISST